jgi:hypothetical protein
MPVTRARQKSTDAAQVITSTTSTTSTQQLRREEGSMCLLVRSELRQCGSQLGVAPPASQLLTSIDVDAMFTRMVDLQYAITERLT